MKIILSGMPTEQAMEHITALKKLGYDGSVQVHAARPPQATAPAPTLAPTPLQFNLGFEGLRSEGLTGEMIIMDYVMTEPRLYHTAEFRRAFRQRGWKGASYSSALSKLVKEGKVNRIRPRQYAKAGVMVQMANAAKQHQQ